MRRNGFWHVMLLVCAWLAAGTAADAVAQEKEMLGVRFPEQVAVEGKTLQLNGLAARTAAFGLVKVYAGGFYLENPTQDPKEVIDSEQVKYFDLHYLTDKATAKKIQEHFVEMMEDGNPAELVKKHRDNILQHASWMDKDMAPGKTSRTVYIPGVGLKVEYQGEVKGVIPGREYAQMYYRYIFGDKADKKLRDGYLGR